MVFILSWVLVSSLSFEKIERVRHANLQAVNSRESTLGYYCNSRWLLSCKKISLSRLTRDKLFFCTSPEYIIIERERGKEGGVPRNYILPSCAINECMRMYKRRKKNDTYVMSDFSCQRPIFFCLNLWTIIDKFFNIL